MVLNLVRFKVGDLVTWESANDGVAKFLGDDEGGMAIIVLTKQTTGLNGTVFPKGLEVKMPHSLIRPMVLN